MKQPKFNFSPSLCHQDVMRHTKPSLAYPGGPVKKWQARLRQKLRELVGLMPRKRVPLNVRSLWQRPHRLGTIEKIVFTSEPYADVPAYVCLPKKASTPYIFMISVQGHSTGMHNSIAVARENNRKPIRVQGDRDFGLSCLAHGVAALCIEQRAFGERRERVQDKIATCQTATTQALLLGRTLIGERVFDVDRGIDYLATRPDVDMKRIGVMGNSGGGTITMFSSALLPRLSFAMPSCYFCTFKTCIMAMYHCECNYIPGLLNYAEMADVMGLFAPRPVVVVAGKIDPIFPIGGVRQAFQDLKKIYRAAGADKRCHLVVGPSGHRFYAKLAWPKMMAELARL